MLIIPMKNKSIKEFSALSDLAHSMQARYSREVASFQQNYNSRHARHIWRHALYKRQILCLLNEDDVSVTIRIVRFLIAGTSETFTFYGSILLPRTAFSFPILAEWIHRKPAILSPHIVHRWADIVSRGEDPSRISRPDLLSP